MNLEFLEQKFNEKKFQEFITEAFDEFELVDGNYRTDKLNESDKEHISEYKYLGETFLDDDSEIGVLVLRSTTKNIENKRVGFSKVVSKLSKPYGKEVILVAIYHEESPIWRLTFVSYDFKGGKQITRTDAKRYTYVMGEDIVLTTAKSRMKMLFDGSPTSQETIEEIFSVEKVSKEFFDKYKTLYAHTLKALQPQMALFGDEKGLALFTKKLLGRIVFLYFLQKKGWLASDENWENGDKKFLRNCFDGTYKAYDDFYTQILQPLFFEALNQDRTEDNDNFKLLNIRIPYLNGGLFMCDAFDKENSIFIENEIFEKIFGLFDQYNFTIIESNPNDSEVAIDPEMLGRIFEDLLEDRKEKGAFYTPREIVHYMCQQSIRNYLETKPKEKTELAYIKQIKILDPAIGSGAFPMGMLHEIVEKRLELGDKTDIATIKIETIQNSIYGIDIEPSAVEIAKLRFWLSIVVDEPKPKPLPNLAYKIMVGNSLISTINGLDPLVQNQNKKAQKEIKLLQSKFHDYFNEHNIKKKEKIDTEVKENIALILQKTVKNFDIQPRFNMDKKEQKKYEEEMKSHLLLSKIIKEYNEHNHTTQLFFYKIYFKDVMDSGGFNIIIGNPPYLRVQGIDKEVSEQYKKEFKSATGSYDLYILFVEKGLSLLAEDGILNYIMPHKWINSAFGKGLREIGKDNLLKFISFGEYQVFNASTYTSLVWFKKSKVKTLEYVESDRDLLDNRELEKYLFGLKKDDYTHIKNKELSKESWIFTDKQTHMILEKLKRQPLRVKDVFEKIFQGIATSKDSVYFLTDCREDESLIKGYSQELDKIVSIEKGLVKPLLKGGDVHRYEPIKTNKVVIFPYYIKDNKAILYRENELKEKFPHGYNYLKECEDILRGRERGKLKDDEYWFRYIYPKNLIHFDREKIITPEISLGSNMMLDSGTFYINTKNYCLVKYPHIKESYKFYLSILNSKLMWFFIKNTGYVLSGGYYTFKTNYLNPFPLPKIENIEDTKPFETLVEYIMLLKTLDKPINEYVTNEHIAKSFEEVIDAMVYELYFKEEFERKLIQFEKEKGHIKFIAYAKEDYAPIDGLDEAQAIETIQQSYQTLKEPYHKIRTNLILLDIEFPDLIRPIQESL